MPAHHGLLPLQYLSGPTHFPPSFSLSTCAWPHGAGLLWTHYPTFSTGWELLEGRTLVLQAHKLCKGK